MLKNKLAVICGVAALAVAVYGMCSIAHRWGRRTEVPPPEHIKGLDYERIRLEAETARLREAVASYSNRAVRAELEMLDERSTTDPLRAHIERMQAEIIRLKAQLKERAPQPAGASSP